MKVGAKIDSNVVRILLANSDTIDITKLKFGKQFGKQNVLVDFEQHIILGVYCEAHSHVKSM